MMRIVIRTILMCALAVAPLPALADSFRLLMVEQSGCVYCRMWKNDIGPIYPKTPEGALAPLEMVQLRGDWPEGVVIGARPAFTPTFLLLKDNIEVARIEGYPGEDFFWGLLGMALRDNGAALPVTQ